MNIIANINFNQFKIREFPLYIILTSTNGNIEFHVKEKRNSQVTRQNITSEMIILLECPCGYIS